MSRNTKLERMDTLRDRAEEIAGPPRAADREGLVFDAAWKLLHELQVHQIELGLQNEELQKSQEEIEKARARYVDLYDMAPVGYLTIDEKNMVVEGNLTFVRLTGVTRDALLTRPFTSLLAAEDADACHLFFREIFRTRAASSCELRLLRADGRYNWVRVDTAFAEKAGTQLACHATVIDISKQREGHAAELVAEKAAADMARQKAAEIETAYIELRRGRDMPMQSDKMSAPGRLSAGMAYELSKPLTGILGIVQERLKRKHSCDTMDSDLQKIAYAAERMMEIIRTAAIPAGMPLTPHAKYRQM